MDDPSLETLLLCLGRDLQYIGLRIQDRSQTCVRRLELIHDTELFCYGITDILETIAEHTRQIAKDVESRIRKFNKEEEYCEIINKLRNLRCGNICDACKSKNLSPISIDELENGIGCNLNYKEEVIEGNGTQNIDYTDEAADSNQLHNVDSCDNIGNTQDITNDCTKSNNISHSKDTAGKIDILNNNQDSDFSAKTGETVNNNSSKKTDLCCDGAEDKVTSVSSVINESSSAKDTIETDQLDDDDFDQETIANSPVNDEEQSQNIESEPEVVTNITSQQLDHSYHANADTVTLSPLSLEDPQSNTEDNWEDTQENIVDLKEPEEISHLNSPTHASQSDVSDNQNLEIGPSVSEIESDQTFSESVGATQDIGECTNATVLDGTQVDNDSIDKLSQKSFVFSLEQGETHEGVDKTLPERQSDDNMSQNTSDSDNVLNSTSSSATERKKLPHNMRKMVMELIHEYCQNRKKKKLLDKEKTLADKIKDPIVLGPEKNVEDRRKKTSNKKSPRKSAKFIGERTSTSSEDLEAEITDETSTKKDQKTAANAETNSVTRPYRKSKVRRLLSSQSDSVCSGSNSSEPVRLSPRKHTKKLLSSDDDSDSVYKKKYETSSKKSSPRRSPRKRTEFIREHPSTSSEDLEVASQRDQETAKDADSDSVGSPYKKTKVRRLVSSQSDNASRVSELSEVIRSPPSQCPKKFPDTDVDSDSVSQKQNSVSDDTSKGDLESSGPESQDLITSKRTTLQRRRKSDDGGDGSGGGDGSEKWDQITGADLDIGSTGTVQNVARSESEMVQSHDNMSDTTNSKDCKSSDDEPRNEVDSIMRTEPNSSEEVHLHSSEEDLDRLRTKTKDSGDGPIVSDADQVSNTAHTFFDALQLKSVQQSEFSSVDAEESVDNFDSANTKKGEAETEPDQHQSSVDSDETEKELKISQFNLNSEARDELLTLLNEKTSGRNEVNPYERNQEEGGVSSLMLDENERNELLDLLTKRVAQRAGEGDAQDDREDAVIDKNELLELVREYEETIIRGEDVQFGPSAEARDRLETKVGGGSSEINNDQEDSDTVLYDVMMEESVDPGSEETKRKKKSKRQEALEAYQKLLEDEDELSDSTSDSSDINPDDLDLDSDISNSDKAMQDAALKRKFGINRELIIRLDRADLEENDRAISRGSSGDSENIDWLCDLSNVLHKRKASEGSSRNRRRKRLRKYSGKSDENVSLSENSEEVFSTDEESDNAEDDLSRIRLVSEDSQEALANALWDNIKNSSDDNFSSSPSDDVFSSSDDEKPKKRRKKCGNDGDEEDQGPKADLDSSDEDDFTGASRERSSWRQDPLLHSDDSDYDSEESVNRRRKRSERIKRRFEQKILKSRSDSDTTIIIDQQSSATPISSDSEVEFVMEKQKSPRSDDDDVTIIEDSPGKKGKGRRNIRALVKDIDLAESTQRAKEEEEARIKRLQEKQKCKGTFTQPQSLSQSCSSQGSDDDADPLILDANEEIQIKVHPKITCTLKPHQRVGIQFMWDSCYESTEQLKKGWEGSGCILAHCMGLGKTRQALALIHSLFSYKISKTTHVLVVCPLSTVTNWKNEHKLAFKNIRSCQVPIFAIQDKKDPSKRFQIVNRWRNSGGMLVLGYEAFGLLTNDTKLDKWQEQNFCQKTEVLEALVDPGPDLVICDEGHLLRNKQTQRSLSLNKVRTKRRVVLTGTPLQNHLLEYYCMVHFVKPNLLGTEREYKTNFVNPISNGQYEDSTSSDILLMKQRTHVLHKLLDRTVQRMEVTELKQYLPKLVDQALFVKLGELQVNFYNTYLKMIHERRVEYTSSGNISRKNFLADSQMLDYVCTHPHLITIASKTNRTKLKERDIVADDNLDDVDAKETKGDWCRELMPPDAADKPELGTKITLVLDILRQAEEEKDKVLIFSQTHAEMDALEYFIKRKLNCVRGVDYFRMDGTSNPEERPLMCAKFNDESDKRLRLFIMSTKVGGLGLNLTAANRVIIMTVNWNPSYDVQSVFRVYRFGQSKVVYVYRMVAMETMEERRYQRQVTKLAIAHRVVDRYQVRRHYNSADTMEMYSARPTVGGERPLPNVPEDKILAKLIQKFPFLYRWHEHQGLLVNQPEEDLNEQQKNFAWEEFNRRINEPISSSQGAQVLNAVPCDQIQPGLAGTQVKGQIPEDLYKPNESHFTDHNYTLPHHNHDSERTNSLEDFRPSQASPTTPRPLPIGPRLDKPITNQATVRNVNDKTTFLRDTQVGPSQIPKSVVNGATVNNVKNNNIVQNPLNVNNQIKSLRSFRMNDNKKQPEKSQAPPMSDGDPSSASSQPTSLQLRMRNFMNHLHMLQNSMKKQKKSTLGDPVNVVSLKPNPHAIGNGTTISAVGEAKPQPHLSNNDALRVVGPNGNTYRIKLSLKQDTNRNATASSAGKTPPESQRIKKVIIRKKNVSRIPEREAATSLSKKPLQSRVTGKFITPTAAPLLRNSIGLKTQNFRINSMNPVQLSSAIASNKENHKRKRALPRMGEATKAANRVLPQDVINTLKRKGVTINCVTVDQDIIGPD